MSRIGRKPIPVPSSVTVKVHPDRVEVEGPQGKLATKLPPSVRMELSDGVLHAVAADESRRARAFQGLARSLVANAVNGAATGFTKVLDIVGIGYRAQVDGGKVVFALGYSHPCEFLVPPGIKIAVEEKNTRVIVSGADKQLVGQVAAEIRSLRPPDPYKQKGVRYRGEILKKKAGKAGKTSAS